MASLKEMNRIKDSVMFLLKNYPHLRDDDNKLIANMWLNEANIKEIDAMEFLKLFSKGKFTSVGSITRMRRKLQEQHIHLRGNKYYERHKEEKNVRQNINAKM